MLRTLGAVILLGGCDLVFSLEEPPPPVPCRHDGLLLCLAFEDSKNLGIDHSPRRLDATASDVQSVEREPGELAIDVGDASQVLLHDEFDLQPPFTIDLWFRYEVTAMTERIILDNHSQYTIRIRAAEVFVDCGTHLVSPPAVQPFIESFGQSNPKTWNHVACVFDGTLLQAHLNGSVRPGTERSTDGPLFTDATEFVRLGRESQRDPSQPDGERVFIGSIDNVRFWNRALDGTQIARIAAGDETPD